jgi:hypothetical protein
MLWVIITIRARCRTFCDKVCQWRQFYWWRKDLLAFQKQNPQPISRKPEDPEKTIDLSQVTDKLYHIMLDTSPWSRFELTTSEVIGTDCIGSCKSNYHTITVQPYVRTSVRHSRFTLLSYGIYFQRYELSLKGPNDQFDLNQVNTIVNIDLIYLFV